MTTASDSTTDAGPDAGPDTVPGAGSGPGSDAASVAERSAAYRTIAAALAWLQAQPDAPSLAEAAARCGLSEFHFQRLFTRWAGISPKRFLQHLARERAVAALRSGADLLGASHAAGLSGPGRLHDLLVTCVAATPGEVRSGGAGLVIQWGVADTPLGPALLASSDRGLMALSFLAQDDAATALQDLQSGWPQARWLRDDSVAAALVARIFARYRQPEPLTLFLRGTPFQHKVWEALLRVPEGALVTYGRLAADLGQPTASRAVGGAVGANPVALLIPCHRVIQSSGALGGYRWGEARKRTLVALELAVRAGDSDGD